MQGDVAGAVFLLGGALLVAALGMLAGSAVRFAFREPQRIGAVGVDCALAILGSGFVAVLNWSRLDSAAAINTSAPALRLILAGPCIVLALRVFLFVLRRPR